MKSVVVAALLAISPPGETDQSLSAIQFTQCPSGCVARCTRRLRRDVPGGGRCASDSWKCFCPTIRQPLVKRPVIRR